MRMNLLMRLVTPDPEKGDRPFDQRPYGRLRLTKPMAERLRVILNEETRFLVGERRTQIDGGFTTEVSEIEDDLKLTRKLAENLAGVFEEKGW